MQIFLNHLFSNGFNYRRGGRVVGRFSEYFCCSGTSYLTNNLFTKCQEPQIFFVGEVAERLNAAVLKTVKGQPFQSSNLCLSAILLL
jgi:hypothetical protein